MVYIHQLKDRLTKWIFFLKGSTLCCLPEAHFKYKDKVKSKGMKKIYH